MSLSPAPHLDVVGGIAFVVFRLGWTKPVALDPRELRFGRLGLVIVAFAGLAACALLAILFEALRGPALTLFSGNFALGLAAFFDVAAGLALSFALFNLLPLPPLTGGHFLQALHPPLHALLERQQTICVIALAAFIVTGLAEKLVAPMYAALGGR
jgi:Zn-dependent protease